LIARRTARFGDFQRSLGVAPNILTARLDSFVAAGLMARRRYSEHPEHYEYLLTGKGRDLAPVIVALTAWGDRHAAPHGPPIIFEHTACGSEIHQQIRCAACEEQIRQTDIKARPGPGLLPQTTTHSTPMKHPSPGRARRANADATHPAHVAVLEHRNVRYGVGHPTAEHAIETRFRG